ncbi:B12-binding domain-containing radical SAM protein, partial [candidate division KSB1 bacterium]|nr:B12-binding domain-containing radical SAM protein [candidate division KSB1 bacterium]
MKDFEQTLINEILPLVNKPGRYLGNELNVIKKDWSKVDVKFALIFPDLYELGMSYIGFDILYHILNRESFIAAERVYAPDNDLERLLRSSNYPLFSLENKRELRDFDIVGFTVQYELHYTNILNILDLGGIKLHAKDRNDEDPIVIAGGLCTYNPEPLAEFIDAFVIGDGEEIVIEIARFIKEARQKKLNRQQILRELSSIDSVYVPQFYGKSDDGSDEIVP